MTKKSVLEQLYKNLGFIRARFMVKHLSLFGSVARDQAGAESDVNILVSFENKAGFDVLRDLKIYLEVLLSATVNLVTEKAMCPQIRSSIEKELINVA